MSTRKTLENLRRYESPNVTFIAEDGTWPMVWQRARGVWVWDVDGRRYMDLTAAFGVAAAGHGSRAVVRAGQKQMGELLHAMGDVHPHPLKAELAKGLSRLTFERWSAKQGSSRGKIEGKTIFGSSGFEAVEAALKTAYLASGKQRVIAFEGAYHGLGYGALNATHRTHFRSPFRRQLREFATFLPFPRPGVSETSAITSALETLLRSGKYGAVLLEPIQARGGVRLLPPGWLAELRAVCNRHSALLILDEIYTGFCRTGSWFACEKEHVMPDLICLGKALTGGFPLSACVGRTDLMDRAWPKSHGEAIHTSTFLGHPVGCRMALAQIEELRRLNLVERSGQLGKFLMNELEATLAQFANVLTFDVRGAGLLVGVELMHHSQPAGKLCIELITRLLKRGYIFLPEGEHANVLSFTPPLTITAAQLKRAVTAVVQELKALL